MLIYVSRGRDMTKVSKKKYNARKHGQVWVSPSLIPSPCFTPFTLHVAPTGALAWLAELSNMKAGCLSMWTAVGWALKAEKQVGEELPDVSIPGGRIAWGSPASNSHSEERRNEQKKGSEGRKPSQELKMWIEVQAALREKIKSLSWPEEGDFGYGNVSVSCSKYQVRIQLWQELIHWEETMLGQGLGWRKLWDLSAVESWFRFPRSEGYGL